MNLHTSNIDHSRLYPAGEDGAPLVVVALCAAWCNTCAEFRPVLEELARSRPDAVFVWLDIEDDADICGDFDVENFPTLVAWRGETILHCGVTTPQAGVVARVVAALAEREASLAVVPEGVIELRAALLGGDAG